MSDQHTIHNNNRDNKVLQDNKKKEGKGRVPNIDLLKPKWGINTEIPYQTFDLGRRSVNWDIAPSPTYSSGTTTTNLSTSFGTTSPKKKGTAPKKKGKKQAAKKKNEQGLGTPSPGFIPKMPVVKAPNLSLSSSKDKKKTTPPVHKKDELGKEKGKKATTNPTKKDKKKDKKKPTENLVIGGKFGSLINTLTSSGIKKTEEPTPNPAIKGDSTTDAKKKIAGNKKEEKKEEIKKDEKDKTSTAPNLLNDKKGGKNTPPKKENTAAEKKTLNSLTVEETDAEKKEASISEQNQNEGLNHGLMVGRSIGYGAKITLGEDSKFIINKFAEGEADEETAKNQYIQDNLAKARCIEDTGQPEPAKEGESREDNPKPGYYKGYIKGYNEGHREGTALKKEAEQAERTAKLEKDKQTDEYKAGAMLGMASGAASANRQPNIEATFMVNKGGDSKAVEVKEPLAKVRVAAFEKKETPGGELSGPIYENAFVQHYNMGYREAKNKQRQGPEIDENYKVGHDVGYKLGEQRGKGGEGDPELLEQKKFYESQNVKELKKEDQQKNRGFFAGYNRGYSQAKKSKKSAAQEALEEKYKDPVFMSGYATGNMKGFIKAIIDPSGIDLLTALNDPKKMDEAGVPEYFPIPDAIRENIKATLIHGEQAKEDKSASDVVKALISKPLFQEGLLMGYNLGYSKGQKSRLSFKQDKAKMHPDYQEGKKQVAHQRTLGQVWAEARNQLNKLQALSNPSEEDKKRLGVLNATISALKDGIDKESKFFQKAVYEDYNAHIAKLQKDERAAKLKKEAEGLYSGEGFEWGKQVGKTVTKSKEKLKELNARGIDITARRAQLNKGIQQAHKDARTKAKQKGQDYYSSYINGYNSALISAKEAKKSDMGNDNEAIIGDLEEKKQSMADLSEITKELAKVDSTIGENKIKSAVNNLKEEDDDLIKKAFEDGAAQGYNLAYEATVYDIKTGKEKTTVDFKQQSAKHLKEKYNSYKSAKDDSGANKHSGDKAIAITYYYALAYQAYHYKEGKGGVLYGTPKGENDAYSFNKGYEVGKSEAVTKEKGSNKKDESSNVTSSTAYEEGRRAALYKARYDDFKGKMIDAAVGKEETTTNDKTGTEGAKKTAKPDETSKKEELTKGLKELKKTEKVLAKSKPKVEASEHYLKGEEDASALWTKIVYLSRGIKLEGVQIDTKVEKVHLLEDGKEKIDQIGNGVQYEAIAKEYQKNKAAYVEKIVNYYMNKREKDKDESTAWSLWDSFSPTSWFAPMASPAPASSPAPAPMSLSSTLSFNFLNPMTFGGTADFSLDASFLNPIGSMTSLFQDMFSGENSIKTEYKEGYLAKIAEIEASFDQKFMEAWLYDFGFAKGAALTAKGTLDIPLPKPPFEDVSVEEVDTNNTHYQNGHFEGMKFGVALKNGAIKPNEEQMAKIYGDYYEDGFKDGKAMALKLGAQAANEPTKKAPTDLDLLSNVDKQASDDKDAASQEDYKRGYLKGFDAHYWKTRDFEYGKSLGYERTKMGLASDTKPEQGVEIRDEQAFFYGFNQGREAEIAGLSEEALKGGKEKVDTPFELIKFLVEEFAWRNGAIRAVLELKLESKLSYIKRGKGDYKRFSNLKAINALGNAGPTMGGFSGAYDVDNFWDIAKVQEEFKSKLGIDVMKDLDEGERGDYKALFDEAYSDTNQQAYAQCLVDLTEVAMVAALQQGQGGGAGLGGSGSSAGLSGNPALDNLVDILYDDNITASGVGGDFKIDRMLLLKAFYDLETKIKQTESYIEGDLKEIESKQELANLLVSDGIEPDKERIKNLELELSYLNLTPKEKVEKRKKLTQLRTGLKHQEKKLKAIEVDWKKAEKAAKRKIESIRLFMKDSLAFDTPLESNEDILEYIRINLQTSEDREEEVYEDLDIFNNLVLEGTYAYSENGGFDTRIAGKGDLYLDESAEEVSLAGDIFIGKNGFEFTAKGLYYTPSDDELFLNQGSIVTPKIEGGEHMGTKYKYTFSAFSIYRGEGIKGQIESQKSILKGGKA